MSNYNAPIRDVRFVLHEVFDAPTVWSVSPAFADKLDREVADAILVEAGKIASQVLAPLNRSGDEEGAKWVAGNVYTPKGFKEAYATYIEGGWVGLSGNTDYGGLGMPKMLSVHFEEMLYGSNSSFALYSVLSSGACLAIEAHASEDIKRLFLPPMYEGRWAGTMCITEPQAGSDLAQIRTRAEPLEDGTYSITGSKIFITGGDHDLTENIIHLVLARISGSPAGSSGLSLFLVPKCLVNEGGVVVGANRVSCGSIEHKMGIKASATCVMNFDGAEGYLLGDVNKGLAAMFTMMNYERLSIGIQGLGCADASYQSAVAYSRERHQGRTTNADPAGLTTAAPIIEHPDVRRMLLTMKALTEGGRAFACYLGSQLDIMKHGTSDARRKAESYVALLTPVAKAFFTDNGLECTILGQQVFGGHGYVREWGQEQLVRDVRISQIYEGTNGIQSLDLLSRKVIADKAAALRSFCSELDDQAEHLNYRAELRSALTRFKELSNWLQDRALIEPNVVGSSSVEYLHFFGHVIYAWLWAKMSTVATLNIKSDESFHAGKIATAEFYFRRLICRINTLEASIYAGSDSLFGITSDQF